MIVTWDIRQSLVKLSRMTFLANNDHAEESYLHQILDNLAHLRFIFKAATCVHKVVKI